MKVSKYFDQGARAFRRREARTSCRFKAPDIVSEWQRGWEAEAEEAAAREARLTEKAKQLRWVDRTSYSQGQRGKIEPDLWVLESSLLPVDVHIEAIKGGGWRIVVERGAFAYREQPAMPLADAQALALGVAKECLRRKREALDTAIAAIDAFEGQA
jgi:hypothetical protein